VACFVIDSFDLDGENHMSKIISGDKTHGASSLAFIDGGLPGIDSLKEENPMRQTIRAHAVIQPGGGLELRHPELPAGTEVEIVILVENLIHKQPTETSTSLMQALERIHHIPIAPSSRRSPEEQDAYIRENRSQWK
jgi:hypothetical protein